MNAEVSITVNGKKVMALLAIPPTLLATGASALRIAAQPVAAGTDFLAQLFSAHSAPAKEAPESAISTTGTPEENKLGNLIQQALARAGLSTPSHLRLFDDGLGGIKVEAPSGMSRDLDRVLNNDDQIVSQFQALVVSASSAGFSHDRYQIAILAAPTPQRLDVAG